MRSVRIGILWILTMSAALQAQDPLQVGYAVMTPAPGSSLPFASSLFSHTESGVLVSEAAVEATRPIRSGIVFVDESKTQTGVALANPASQAAQATLILRDASGVEAARMPLAIGPSQHIARFAAELFPGLSSSFLGTLAFESDIPLAAVALRQNANARGERLYAAMPVFDSGSPATQEPLIIPHVAAGGGYTTEIVLVNVTNQVLLGRCSLIASSGQPLTVDDGARSEFNYRIEPRGAVQLSLANTTGLGTGYAVVSPSAGSPAPRGSAIFQLHPAGTPMTEASVGAVSPTTLLRLFVDEAGTSTGFAVANPGPASTTLQIALLDRSGMVEAQEERVLAAGNHMAIMAKELFPSALYDGFSGMLQVQSAVPVAAIALKVTTNSRGDVVLTTLPVADLMRPPSTESVVFPQIVVGGDFTTRLLFVNSNVSASASGTLSFRQSSGAPLTLPLAGQSGDTFQLQIAAGAGRRAYPGNGNRITLISILDPRSNQTTTELTINEGNSVRPRLRMVDAAGNQRDDYDAVLVSSNTEVATVDAGGRVAGRKSGFASIGVAAGGAVAAMTATVVRLESGGAGFGVVGVTQDLSRRLYLAVTPDHTILRARDFKQTPEIYAGTFRAAGLKNDRRLQSQFQNPAFLALNQAEGSLYVSDSANNVIRRAFPGDLGAVVTYAGTGSLGNLDGPSAEASFSNPQGLALDRRGNLWVADSGNHTIRVIDVSTGNVRTIAGLAGAAGASDGIGAQARFSSPAGIAVEIESLSQQLERQRTGAPAPPVSVIVADTGNGLLRRVREGGEVETLASPSGSPAPQGGRDGLQVSSAITAGPSLFNAPVAVAVDSTGNIYVSESGAVRIRLRNGDVVSAVQNNSLREPRGIVAMENAEFL